MTRPTLTLFSTPKSFETAHTAVIQENAMRSWAALGEACQVLVVGDDPGVAEAAARVKVRHIAEVARNASGTPLVSDIFARAAVCAASDVLCYVNADVMFMDDLVAAARAVAREGRPFLMVGRRTNLDVREPLDFSGAWADGLRRRARAEGELFAHDAIDYMCFSRGLFDGMPAFAIGRPKWDNWMIFHALTAGAMVVDATARVMAVHQNHDYGHVAYGDGTSNAVWQGHEAEENLRLAGGVGNVYTIHDATHVLTAAGVRRTRGGPYLVARLEKRARERRELRLPLRVGLGVARRIPRLRRYFELEAPRGR